MPAAWRIWRLILGNVVDNPTEIYLTDLQAAIDSLDRMAVRDMADKLRACQGIVYVLGNGGSQSNASHLVLHLSMSGMRGMDMASAVAMLTAFSNDYAYAAAPLQYLRATARPGDALLVISGSGDSPNVLTALAEAKRLGLLTLGLLGFNGGAAAKLCDYAVVLASRNYGPVEDCHSTIIHIMQDWWRKVP